MADPFIGEINIFGFNFAPRGYGLCAGGLMTIAQNTALFSLLGTMYGGNGRSDFALPDLKSRMPLGQGQGPGLPFYDQGDKGGVPSVTLNIAHMPAHDHSAFSSPPSVALSLDVGTTPTPTNGSYLADVQSGGGSKDLPELIYRNDKGNAGTALLGGVSFSTSGSTDSSGGGQPFSVQNPYLAMNFSIALTGTFPPRN